MDHYKETFQSWNKVAKVYQDYFMDIQLYDDTYDTFCRLVAKNGARVFEIGCGPGNITRYLLSKRPDFQLEAIDIAPNMIALARQNNPGADFKIMDTRAIDSLPSGNFDGIVCGFCLPYLAKSDGIKLIQDCAALLAPGGILYLSTIEGDYGNSGPETSSDGQHTMYVYYYESDFIGKIMEENAFGIIDLSRKEYAKKDGTQSTHLIFTAQKKGEQA